MGERLIDRAAWSWQAVEENPFWCPDAAAAAAWEDYLDAVRQAGSSVGAVIEVQASGLPAGLGSPVYGKLDAELAAAIMSINAVKGVEIGAGFGAATLRGEENADAMRPGDGAVKPTSSIPTAIASVDRSGKAVEASTGGRHDPCVGIRAVPVGEAMVACVLADQLLRQRAQCG
jgi:chorismate synthase